MTNADHSRREALHRALFAELEAPPIPEELASDRFLEGIFERAVTDSAADLGPALDAGLAPLQAPEDASWTEVVERPELVDQVAEVLPGPGRAPGWMWTQIRSEVRAEQRKRRLKSTKSRYLRVAAAAAVLLTAGFLAINLSRQGTNETPRIVFELDPDVSADDSLLGRSAIR